MKTTAIKQQNSVRRLKAPPVETRACWGCGEEKPLNSNNFGHTPSGNFRGKCRVCIRAAVAKHSRENPELVRQRLKRRKSLETAKFSPNEKNYMRHALMKKQRNKCFFCKERIKGKGELDHLASLKNRGEDGVNNLVLACFICNRQKHGKTASEYRIWLRKCGLPVLF